ncbi:UBP1-associated proteins 1C [Canna indica]|uniref:UBP1-associated proteins 1C n=1 Tax=Canna indica TaxID=4628 RepID=A0AAQ3K6X2_9LILI|nr:UBP1-associated proteins 1C [Canna indica]
MVWFQCEDCGENLKKPKLPNHFRICSAYKLSCIDCGKTFDQESVQSHTQCISEAEKYGPKDQAKASRNAQAKPDKPKPNADVDINVGLSSRPPWFCSLCNTNATSQQTLLGHADGKKHRAKARAFHAAQKQVNGMVEPTSEEIADDKQLVKSVESNGSEKEKKSNEPNDSTNLVTEVNNQSSIQRKRKSDAISKDFLKDNEKSADDLRNGEVIQAGETEEKDSQSNKEKHAEDHQDKKCKSKESSHKKIKWKKLITCTLKSDPDQTMKIKKLQKIVIKMVQESGVTVDEPQLREILMDKINSSSRFVVDNKRIQLVSKAAES